MEQEPDNLLKRGHVDVEIDAHVDALTARFDFERAIVHGKAINALGGDMYLATFAEVMYQETTNNPQFRFTLTEQYAMRKRVRPPEPIVPAAETIRIHRTYQRFWMSSPAYPLDKRTVAQVRSGMYEVLEDDETFGPHLYLTTVETTATNIEQRMIGAELGSIWLRERFPGQPLRFVDAGASQNRSLKKSQMSQFARYAYHPLTLGHVDESGDVRKLVADEQLTSAANAIVNTALPLQLKSRPSHALSEVNTAEGSFGFDVWPIADSEVQDWALACRFRPAEYNKTAVKQYKDFQRMGPHIPFIDLDMINADHDTIAAKFGKEPVHAMIFSAVLHQFTEEQQAAVIEKMRPFMHPEGFMIIIDTMQADTGSPIGLSTDSSWKCFNTFVLDMAHPEDGPQHIAEFIDGGRATKVAVGAGRLAIHGHEKLSLEQMLKKQA